MLSEPDATAPDPKPATPAPGRRGEPREAAILAAVVALVGERGYERVTVDGIAARARASKATIYRRWATKAELVVDALRRHAGGSAAVELADTGSVRGDLKAALDGIERVITGSSGVSLLKLVEAVRDDARLRELIRGQVRDGSVSAAAAIVNRARDRGELTAAPACDCSRVLEVGFGQLLLGALLNGGAAAPDERDALVDTVLLPLFHTLSAPATPSP